MASPSHEMLVMMIPSTALGAADAVAVLGPHVEAALPSSQPKLWITMVTPPLRERVTQTPERLVLFAHPTDDFGAFRVNGTTGDSMITPPWWDPPQCKLLVANVCNGALVLRDPQWAAVFPRWISFLEKLWVYTNRTGTARWSRVFAASVEAARTGKTLRSVYQRVRDAYVSEITDLADSFSIANGDDIHLICFQRALRALAKSEDA